MDGMILFTISLRIIFAPEMYKTEDLGVSGSKFQETHIIRLIVMVALE